MLVRAVASHTDQKYFGSEFSNVVRVKWVLFTNVYGVGKTLLGGRSFTILYHKAQVLLETVTFLKDLLAFHFIPFHKAQLNKKYGKLVLFMLCYVGTIVPVQVRLCALFTYDHDTMTRTRVRPFLFLPQKKYKLGVFWFVRFGCLSDCW